MQKKKKNLSHTVFVYLTLAPQVPFLVYQKHEKLQRKKNVNLGAAVVVFESK